MTYCKLVTDALGRAVVERRGRVLVMPLRAVRPSGAVGTGQRCRVIPICTEGRRTKKA
jgi:hypothetical protein